MDKRVFVLLRELKIGLSALNHELRCLNQVPVDLNSKISDHDFKFLKEYFQSKEMKELISAYQEVANCRHRLNNRLNELFMKSSKSIDELGEIEKRLYFMWIINYGKRFNSFSQQFPNISNSHYSEETFENLFKWYSSMIEKNKKVDECIEDQDIDDIIDGCAQSDISRRRCPDEESMIMSALRGGCGDIFGF